MERIGPSFTLNEWLEHRRMSRAEWYRRRARGDNLPDTYGKGRGQRISPQADAEYLRRDEEAAAADSEAA